MQLPVYSRRTAGHAALAAAVGFSVVASFQLLLTLGMPWGRAVLGGANEGVLPADLRVVTSVSTVVYIIAALIVLGRAGHLGLRFAGVYRIGTWVLVVAMAVGAVMNFASSSPWERFIWGPVAIGLAVAAFVLARGHTDERSADVVDAPEVTA